LDLYSIRLSSYLQAPTLHTDAYQRVRERFHKPLFSPSTLKELHFIWKFAKTLDKLEGIPHLPNHHLGRIGLLLKKPFIITVHDLIRYFDAKGYGPLIHKPNLKDRLLLRSDYEGVKKAVKIIVPSQRTKLDVVKHLEVPEEKVEVIYHGIDEIFKPTYGWRPCEEPYILYVGSEHPRKNLATLFKAFSRVKQENPELKDLKLVKAGRAGGREAKFREETLRLTRDLGISEDVIILDWVPQSCLASLYTGAELFAFPSLYEGFGWPPLEAMACGCPVLSSNAACMPEVLGDAALYVDPWDVEGWKQALATMLTDEGLRRKLAYKGMERASRFTWRRAAEQTLALYKEVEEGLSSTLKCA